MGNLESDVIAFIEQELCVKRHKITLKSRIGADFGCVGDDAEEFMLAFSERFEFDLSKFHFSKHFDSEGLPPEFALVFIPPVALIYFLYRIFFDRKKAERKKTPVRVADLVKAANLKEWDEIPA